ncbi:hypothetical protein VCCP104417_1211, partial [Vibrio cholerae CP1044(17)]|jgi:hypothetical protein
MLIA